MGYELIIVSLRVVMTWDRNRPDDFLEEGLRDVICRGAYAEVGDQGWRLGGMLDKHKR